MTSESKIAGLYVAYFRRASDLEGLTFWEARATKFESEKVLKELSSNFAKHPTFVSTYSGLDNRTFVETIYKNVLSKAGDAEGIAYWTQYLNSGKSRSDMVSDFVEISLTQEVTSENFPNLTAQQLATAQERQNFIANKVEVALSFTTLLGTHTNVTDALHPESDPAYQASIKILINVVDDRRSVSTAIDFLNTIKDDDDPIGRINQSVEVEDEPEIVVNDDPNLKLAKDNTLNDVIALFNGLTIKVTTNTTIDTVSNETIAIYGNVRGQNTGALLKLNANYPNGTKFVVKVYEGATLVGSSQELTYSGVTINFNDIN